MVCKHCYKKQFLCSSGNTYFKPFARSTDATRFFQLEDTLQTYRQLYPLDLVFIAGDFNAHSATSHPNRKLDAHDLTAATVLEYLQSIGYCVTPDFHSVSEYSFVSDRFVSLIDFSLSWGFSEVKFSYVANDCFGHRPQRFSLEFDSLWKPEVDFSPKFERVKFYPRPDSAHKFEEIVDSYCNASQSIQQFYDNLMLAIAAVCDVRKFSVIENTDSFFQKNGWKKFLSNE